MIHCNFSTSCSAPYKIVRSLFVINLFILFQREIQIWIFFKFLDPHLYRRPQL